MKGIGLGDNQYIAVRNLKVFIDGAKTANGRIWIQQWLRRNAEIDGFIMLTIVRKSKAKYYVNEVITEDNTWVFDHEEMPLTADWYDIKLLNRAVEVTYYNELFGEQTEYRMPGDE